MKLYCLQLGTTQPVVFEVVAIKVKKKRKGKENIVTTFLVIFLCFLSFDRKFNLFVVVVYVSSAASY